MAHLLGPIDCRNSLMARGFLESSRRALVPGGVLVVNSDGETMHHVYTAARKQFAPDQLRIPMAQDIPAGSRHLPRLYAVR